VRRTYRQSDCAVPGAEHVGQSRRDASVDEQRADRVLRRLQLQHHQACSRAPWCRACAAMYNQQFQVGYEQEIVEDLVLGTRWLHTDGRARGRGRLDQRRPELPHRQPRRVGVAKATSPAQQAQCTDARRQAADAGRWTTPSGWAWPATSTTASFLADAFDRVDSLFDKPATQLRCLHLRGEEALRTELDADRLVHLQPARGQLRRLRGSRDRCHRPRRQRAVRHRPSSCATASGRCRSTRPTRAQARRLLRASISARRACSPWAPAARVQSGLPISLRAGHNALRRRALVYVLPRGAGGRIQPNA
jgi:hypothetical protein